MNTKRRIRGGTPKKLPAEARKVQLHHCAVKTFARSNYRGTRITDIARQAGISEAMIYRHFPSKKAIYLNMLEKISDDIMHHWQKARESAGDELEALRSIGTASYDYVRANGEASRVYFQAISEIDDAEIASRLREDHRKFKNYISEIVQSGIERGIIREDVDIRVASALLGGRGTIITILDILSFEKRFTTDKIAKMIDYSVQMLQR